MLLQYETKLWNQGVNHIAGVDEVGRGALAGPLVVGAVILNIEHLHPKSMRTPKTQNNDISTSLLNNYIQIKDSKLISPNKRARLAEFIRNEAICYSIETIAPATIDTVGITQATQLAFFAAIKNLTTKAQHVLTDTFEIKKLTKEHQTNIKRGDTLSISIAAASIIAKVYRDNLMVQLHQQKRYKKYSFHKHKGYGTKLHKETIFEHGPSDIHRMCFEPIKSMFE
jgi:ribonuclease HII